MTPLSHNVGIVCWVPHCDTLHALIRDYRDSRKASPDTGGRAAAGGGALHRVAETGARTGRLSPVAVIWYACCLSVAAVQVLLGMEHKVMLQHAPDYDSLPLMHKVRQAGRQRD